jgi:hypothetical protein
VLSTLFPDLALELTAKILPGNGFLAGTPLRSSVFKEQALMKEAYGETKEMTTGIHQSPEGDGPLPDFSVGATS